MPEYLQGGTAHWSEGHPIVVYKKHSSVGYLHDGVFHLDPLPKNVLSRSHQWDVTWTDDKWVLIARHANRIAVSRPEDLHFWDIRPQGVSITPEWVHLDLGQMTAHLPTMYRPGRCEKTLNSWYIFENPDEGRNKFQEDIHVWWSQSRMIARHNPHPYTGEFHGMVWTSDDIPDEGFENVEIADHQHVIVNDTFLLDTRFPEVKRL